MNHLLRELAPITETAWDQIDDEARTRLAPALAARRLVDFAGPHGWQHSATSLGRVAPLPDVPAAGARGLQRTVLPLVELRVPFSLPRSELEDIGRGAVDADFSPLDKAAHEIAAAENRAVLSGWPGVFQGVTGASPFSAGELGDAAAAFPGRVADALNELRASGIGGPYALALGPEPYRLASASTEHGALLLDHLGQLLGGPIVWTPGLSGGVLLSQRGGDFLFESGQDLSVGYVGHDGESVALYLEESFSFRVATPEAAVAFSA